MKGKIRGFCFGCKVVRSSWKYAIVVVTLSYVICYVSQVDASYVLPRPTDRSTTVVSSAIVGFHPYASDPLISNIIYILYY